MSRPATTTGTDRILHCSPDRTLFVTTEGDETVVCKVFLRGSLDDAEREVELGRKLAHLGVAGYRQARVDPVTHRPAVVLDWHDGLDLDRTIARSGAIPAARAAELLVPVARTLAAMHDAALPGAPHGICHGDVKPGNLLRTASTTLVLDLEHARPIGAGDAARQVTGTPGFASPEARAGSPPRPALDVYGLGATLRWMLTGGGLSRLPQDAEVDALVRACTADDPNARPGAERVAATLAGIARRLDGDSEEGILNRLAAGERIEFVSDSPRYAALQRLAARQRRLLRRFPKLLQPPDAPPASPAGLHLALHNAQRALRHFPRHEPTLAWRHTLRRAARDLLANAAETVSSHQREERHDDAARWLEDAVRLTRALLQLPGGQPIPGAADPRAAGLLQRDPIAFLRRLEEQLAEAKAELDAAIAAIDAAEERLDLEAAEAAIDAMADRYGGSSPTAARRRDQLHRLTFYFDRIGNALPNVERLGQTWDKNALEPLADFVGGCARAADRLSSDDAATTLGLRSLQVTLVNLAEEFPHLYMRSGPALDALSSALQHTSDLAWELVGEARQQLDAVPVPVRPLQITLGRLDTFRILEALVDRPERPRSQLLDSIESLRLKFETARAARDRLAEGAEEAMARGHWTTGLFDMERAVAGLNPNDELEREEAERLEGRLREARRKKRELEEAVRRNVELGNQYGTQQDDATSTFEERLATLEERRDCLRFLAEHLPAERAQLYASDLREVELHIALEQAGIAEAEFDATEDSDQRLRLAQQTLARLEASASTAEFAGEPPGRLLRIVEHWRTLVDKCRRDHERQSSEQRLHRRGRRRTIAALAMSLLISLTAIGWAAGPWLWSNVFAGSRQLSLAELEERARSLPLRARAAAGELLAAVRRATSAGADFDAVAWHRDFAAALTVFAAEIDGAEDADAPALRAFGSGCWETAVAAARAADPGAHDELRRATEELARELAGRGIAPPERG